MTGVLLSVYLLLCIIMLVEEAWPRSDNVGPMIPPYFFPISFEGLLMIFCWLYPGFLRADIELFLVVKLRIVYFGVCGLGVLQT